MTETLIDDQFINNDKRFYSVKQITIGTFIGGPFAAAYYLSKNFQNLNQPDDYRKSYFGFGLLGIVLILLLSFIPNADKIPSYIIPMAYTFGAKFYAENNQKRPIEHEIVNGSSYNSNWNVAFVSFLSLLLFVILFFAFFLLVNRND